jgi:hypothetical protein
MYLTAFAGFYIDTKCRWRAAGFRPVLKTFESRI